MTSEIKWVYFKTHKPFTIDLNPEGLNPEGEIRQAHALRPALFNRAYTMIDVARERRQRRRTFCPRSSYAYDLVWIAPDGAAKCRRCEEIILQETKEELIQRLGARHDP